MSSFFRLNLVADLEQQGVINKSQKGNMKVYYPPPTLSLSLLSLSLFSLSLSLSPPPSSLLLLFSCHLLDTQYGDLATRLSCLLLFVVQDMIINRDPELLTAMVGDLYL
jgi:hypothetical protein